MQRKSIKAAAMRIMRKLNRRKNTAADNHNDCWNAATEAYGYAAEGKTVKAKAALVRARAACRRFM